MSGELAQACAAKLVYTLYDGELDKWSDTDCAYN